MDDQLKTQVKDPFGFDRLSPEEQTAFLCDVGGLILESAVLRFLAESDPSTAEHFARMIDAYADKDDLHFTLAETFPTFGIILEEEAEAFRKDANRVLSNSAQ